MRLAVVGGALQGMEAVYLARKAGYHVDVFDRDPGAPALSLCDEAHVTDPVRDPEAGRMLDGYDFILPANENPELLDMLSGTVCADRLLFDRQAYRVSSSKLESNMLMATLGVPMPEPWPECGFPAVVKPSSLSGSIGVTVAQDRDGLEKGVAAVASLGDEPVVQGFVSGMSVSVEVVGDGRDMRPYVTTEVCLDPGYDCKMVRCHPGILGEEDESVFRSIGGDIARSLGLRGLMDVEAILTPAGLRVLEIDARIPSQTPAAVLSATGINLLEELVRSAGGDWPRAEPEGRASVYRHLMFSDGILRTTGEKEFSHVRHPHMEVGLFGSDEMITDYSEDADEWRATVIVSADTAEAAEERSDDVVRRMMDACSTDVFVDGHPGVL